MLIKELQNFGLSEKEARVYLAALELGTATIQELSQKSEVNRATTYIQVESLLTQGLLSTVDKDKKSLFIAERPNTLLRILENRKTALELQEDKIRKLIPDLEGLNNELEDKPRVRFFEGLTGMSAWQTDLYKQAPKQVNLIMPLLEDFEKTSEDPGFLEKMYNRNDIESIRILAPVEKREFMQSWPVAPKMEMRFHQVEGLKVEMVVYNGRVFINRPKYKNPMSVLFEDKFYAESFQAIYDFIWNNSTK